jgi:signal transduction histidine kinase
MRLLTTLRSQFVVVVATAVIISNLAVMAILEAGREGELRGARTDAAIDRIAAVFDYISNIPISQRDEAVNTLSGRVFQYAISDTAPIPKADMGEEEERIANTLVSDEGNKALGVPRVRVTTSIPIVPGLYDGEPTVEIAQAMSTGRWVSARFERQPFPSPAPDILISAAFGTLLTGAAAAWLQEESRVLSALAFAADDVARGRIAPRLRAGGPDDIRRAAEAFNAMSDRVTRTLESQRQLLSAVGHDLRTPIAAMRITAEFVEGGEVRDRLTRNLDELQSLTEAVLASARSTPGEEKRRVDLSSLIESVCDDLVELGLPVEVDVPGAAPCLCRPNEIRRAIRNWSRMRHVMAVGARIVKTKELSGCDSRRQRGRHGRNVWRKCSSLSCGSRLRAIPQPGLVRFNPFSFDRARAAAMSSAIAAAAGLEPLRLPRRITRESGGGPLTEVAPKALAT